MVSSRRNRSVQDIGNALVASYRRQRGFHPTYKWYLQLNWRLEHVQHTAIRDSGLNTSAKTQPIANRQAPQGNRPGERELRTHTTGKLCIQGRYEHCYRHMSGTCSGNGTSRPSRSLRQRAYSPASPQRRFSGPRTLSSCRPSTREVSGGYTRRIPWRSPL